MRVSFKSKVIGLVAGTVLALSLASCQSVTPANRIAANPQVFQSLPAQQKSLVQQGHICEGMSPEAVFLAWGYPNVAPFVGQKDGKTIVRWVYSQMEPVMVTPNWAGPYWGPYGWYDPAYYGSSTAFVPRNTAYVTFENNKVVSWGSRNK